jgi:hypothetical protein
MVMLLVAVAVVVATVLGSDWVAEEWLGEERRFWVAFAGLGVMALGAAVVQASGIGLLTRALRGFLIGSIVRRYGPDWPWLRRILRAAGIETEPETRTAEQMKASGLHWSGMSSAFLLLGEVLSLAGMAMVWVGVFGG